ncbi:hypothetical protein BVRB_2g038880 [Beta vulgaris subsp. vulgaris]|nr:hypothetical protein BVRB_2g038880 [Beta vulgaris subsp. vulgaris]
MEFDLLNLWGALSPGGTKNLAERCDEIIEIFSRAKYQVLLNPLAFKIHHSPPPTQPLEMAAAAASLEYPQQHPPRGKGKEVAGEAVDVYMKAESGGQEKQSSSLGQLRTTSKRSSSRTDDLGGNRRMRMAAPKIGNTEMPPEDGFTWRKYGQKEILNAKYPRSYYRCTHQKLCNCPAKKQVQRLDDDPYTFDILYRGEHTCHMSNTAPSSVPPPPSPPPTVHHDIFVPHQPITTVGYDWLSRASSEDACTIFSHNNNPLQQQLYSVSSSTSSVLGMHIVEAAPSSTVRSHQGRSDQVVDLLTNNHHSLVDWSEMFNSGSSSTNSMEIIFPPANDKMGQQG